MAMMSVLFTLWRILAATTFQMMPAMTWGRSWTATFKGSKCRTSCIRRASQKLEEKNDIIPRIAVQRS